ncbi:MAG TPA: FxLYD domain-containing protein, partial [Thermoanaerobaculia bacterium]|nr:FxLYD domain-containing protein [Thermoanaerobaculia bacterium]
GGAAADATSGTKPEDAKADAATKNAKSEIAVNKGKSSPVVVGSWQKVERDQKDGIELFGDLKNESAEIASQVALIVTLLDETGNAVATGEATLTANAIEPHSATNFRAVFPGVYTFASARFDIRSAPLKLQVVAPPADKGKS